MLVADIIDIASEQPGLPAGADRRGMAVEDLVVI